MKSISWLVVLAAALMVLPAFAQEREGGQDETTMTGCLNAGGEQGQYLLTVNEGAKKGQKVAVTGAADLEKHAKNHTVKVTGTVAQVGGKDVLKVSKIEHVDATCQPATE